MATIIDTSGKSASGTGSAGRTGAGGGWVTARTEAGFPSATLTAASTSRGELSSKLARSRTHSCAPDASGAATPKPRRAKATAAPGSSGSTQTIQCAAARIPASSGSRGVTIRAGSPAGNAPLETTHVSVAGELRERKRVPGDVRCYGLRRPKHDPAAAFAPRTDIRHWRLVEHRLDLARPRRERIQARRFSERTHQYAIAEREHLV